MAESKQTLLTGLANTHKRPVNLLQTRVVQVVLPWLLPALLLLAWQAVSTWQLLPEQYLRNISSPWAVVQAGWGLLTSGELWGHLGISAARAAAGLLVGGVVGLTLGVATGLSPLLARISTPPPPSSYLECLMRSFSLGSPAQCSATTPLRHLSYSTKHLPIP